MFMTCYLRHAHVNMHAYFNIVRLILTKMFNVIKLLLSIPKQWLILSKYEFGIVNGTKKE